MLSLRLHVNALYFAYPRGRQVSTKMLNPLVHVG